MKDNKLTLQLFTKLVEMENKYKCNKMPIKLAWIKRPGGLIKVEGNTSTFKRACLD
jgi:hypothetical protein